MLKNDFLLAWLALLISTTAIKVNADQLSAKIDNDGAFGEDGHYTSGLYLSWESKPLRYDPLKKVGIPFPQKLQQFLLFKQTNAKSASSFLLSQRMWTPRYIKTTLPQQYDRPYAGHLELSSTITLYSPETVQKNWLALGTTGSESLSGQLQVFYHNMIGSSPAQGWDNQIEQQITWQIGYEIEKKFFRKKVNNDWQFDSSAVALVDMGNFRQEVFTGITLRLGQQLPNSFGRLNNRYGNTGNLVDVIKTSAVITYAKAQIGYRFNDLTLEGKLAYNSLMTSKPQQQKYALGVLWGYKQYLIDFNINAYSKDYQQNPESWHGYGGLLLAIAL